MSAKNEKNLGTSVGVVYVAKYLPSAVIPDLLADGSNADAVLTAIKTAYTLSLWKELASSKETKIEENVSDGLQEVTADDGRGLVYSVVNPTAKLTTTWLESKDKDALGVITGVAPVSVTESTVNYNIYASEQKTMATPRVAVMILASRPDGKIEEYYAIDCKVTGSIVTEFLKFKGVPAGSQLTFERNDGGLLIKKIPE